MNVRRAMVVVITTALTHLVLSPAAAHLDINSPLMDFTVKVRRPIRRLFAVVSVFSADLWTFSNFDIVTVY